MTVSTLPRRRAARRSRGERVAPFATQGLQPPRRRPMRRSRGPFLTVRIFFRPPATLLTMPSKPIAVRVPATLEGSGPAVMAMRKERVEHFSGGSSGNDCHAVSRWYLELDLSSRTDRLLLAVQPARHESFVDVPHPHPATQARLRTCPSDRTRGVSNARGIAPYIGFFPMTLRAMWTVLRGKQIKFLIPSMQRPTRNAGLSIGLRHSAEFRTAARFRHVAVRGGYHITPLFAAR